MAFNLLTSLSLLCLAAAAPVSSNYPKEADVTLIGTQSAIFPFLGGSAPYFKHPMDLGIPVEAPDQCTMKQIQLFARHGERYPTYHRGGYINSTYNKLMAPGVKLNGSLSFLNDDYEFFLGDGSNLEELSTLDNIPDPINPYTGEQDAQRHARDFMYHYGELLENTTTFPIFTSNSKRVHDTAQYFGKALGSKFNVSMQIIAEDVESGANTLTPFNSCWNYNETESADVYSKYSQNYLKSIIKRLTSENPSLNLTTKDASNLFDWCSFELDIQGYSAMCEVFTPEELVYYSYNQDLLSYYQEGPGNSLSKSVGSVPFNSSITLLKQSDELDLKVWLSFTHDLNLINYMTAVGLFDTEDLPADHIPFKSNPYHRAWIVPLGARIYTQLYQCSNQSYVRYVVNDAVVPLDKCSSGPGFSCELEEFLSYAESRLSSTDFLQECRIREASNTTALTFYWDYQEREYNAELFLSESDLKRKT